MLELVIDSFAGGGGASTGIAAALGRDPDYAINHDAEADDIGEVISSALRLYEACVAEIKAGSEVVIRRTDGTETDAFET